MRVITGTARGRVLKTLNGEDVRPTTEKVKEAIFSMIQFEIEGRKMLDLFAGSGQMGIEALSRGAESAVFTDMSKASVEIIKKNLLSTGLDRKAAVFQTDAITFLKSCRTRFDIIFMDPPYSEGLLQEALPYAEKVVSDYGVIICEHPYGEKMPEDAGRFSVYREYKYGKLALTVYRKREAGE